jgi:hypothetical protein
MGESIADIIASIVEGTIVGLARAFTETPFGRRKPGVVLETDGIVVRRVTDHTSKDVEDALDLLAQERRIAADEKRARDEMIRFVRESNEKGWFRHRKFRDHLFVAGCGDRTDAMAFFTYYPRERRSAIAYFIARPEAAKKGNTGRATLALARALVKFHRQRKARSIVAEVDDPRLTSSPPERNRRYARIKLFAGLAEIEGRRLHILDVPYMQPALEPTGTSGERQMLLIYVPFRPSAAEETLQRRDIISLLQWLYGRVYADAYLTNPRLDTAYRQYLAAVTKRVLGGVPDSVRSPEAASWIQSSRGASQMTT